MLAVKIQVTYFEHVILYSLIPSLLTTVQICVHLTKVIFPLYYVGKVNSCFANLIIMVRRKIHVIFDFTGTLQARASLASSSCYILPHIPNKSIIKNGIFFPAIFRINK